MLIVGADLETTGFKAEKGHRIVEVCFQLWDTDKRAKVREFSSLINPLRSIPQDASNVHGIYLEDLHHSPTWEKVAPAISKMLSVSKVFVAHNVGFDGPFMGHELARVGAAIPDIDTFCTMLNGRWATGNGKNPKLAELCWALEVPFNKDEAHRASYDVDAMMQCLWKGIDAGMFILPTQE